MKRILYLFAAVAAILLAAGCGANKQITYSVINDNAITLYSDEIEDDVRLLVISDTHLWQYDEREEPFRKYSSRMAGAYHKTVHYNTGAPATPIECLKAAADYAVKNKVDAIVCTGDMVSYPSEYGVELLKGVLDGTGIPWYYTAGNHDWHYEGMEGSQLELRDEWVRKRLMPLYPEGVNPLCYSIEIKGLKLLMIDDGISEVTKEQLDFFRQEDKEGKPMLLFMHVPMYAPGTSAGYSIGHPDWNAANDDKYVIEKREPWPAGGHAPEDYSFREEFLKSDNAIASFSGHVHSYAVFFQNGKPCFTVGANCRGGFFDVKILKKF